MSSGAMQSKVGNPQVYNDGDQRTSKSNPDVPSRFEAGQPNSHQLLDPKDERTLSNTIAAAERAEEEDELRDSEKTINDPLKPAQDHGNDPSRGAEIDAEIKADEEEYLRNKGKV